MQQCINPPRDLWSRLCQRPSIKRQELDTLISAVYEQVIRGGDSALVAITKQYDGILLPSVSVALGGATAESKQLDRALRQAIDAAYRNIKQFHKAQRPTKTRRIETVPGVQCWRESRAIESVGLYIPGGTAPLVSTMLMLGIPAQIAGCKQVVVCTPPRKDGTVDPAIRYAAAKCGIGMVYMVGGAQAIAAMAIGTETIPRVNKIFGPGNQYVTAAKQMAERYGVAIDMPAGPSEVLVIADETAEPRFVAADLLSQAEHGPDSQVVLLTTSVKLRNKVLQEIALQCALLPRQDIAAASLKRSLAVVFKSLAEAFEFANEYAPEHIILQVADAATWVPRVINAGSVFIGPYTPESAGDYASGPNHTLPTAGWAKSYGGVSLDSFQRMVTFQEITRRGLATLAPTITRLALAEGLDAHARAVSIRQSSL